MRKTAAKEETLLQTIRSLPPEKATEVEDYLRQRDDRRLTRAASKLSEKAFSKTWDNPDDAAYDRV